MCNKFPRFLQIFEREHAIPSSSIDTVSYTNALRGHGIAKIPEKQPKGSAWRK